MKQTLDESFKNHILGFCEMSAKPDSPPKQTGGIIRDIEPDSKNTQEHLSQSAITPVPSINTLIIHAKRCRCKQCRTMHSAFFVAAAPLIGWIDCLRHLML